MQRLFFTICTFAFTLVIIEGFARLFPLPTLESPSVGMQLQAHPSRIWSMTPGTQKQFGATVTIDGFGMRATEKSPDSEKWLILGDSSFFGHGLNDDGTLHHHLEQALKTEGAAIDVLCGATPGYSTLQTLDFMNEIGWNLKPSVLVIGNLWSDNNFDHFQDAEWMADLNQPRNQALQFMKQSHAFIQFIQLLRPELLDSSAPEANPHAKISWVRDPFANGKRRVPLPLYIETLSTLILEAESRNIAVLLIQPANRHRLDIVDVEVTWDPYFKGQSAIAKHFDVPIIDVAPTLRAFGLSKSDAFLDDMHPTSQANFWLAQSIVDKWKPLDNAIQAWIPRQNIVPEFTIDDRWSTMSTINRDTLP